LGLFSHLLYKYLFNYGELTMNKYTSLVAITLITVLSACSSHIQTTSGQSYLQDYDSFESSSAQAETDNTQSIDSLVKQVAAVEPTLRFPARIGVARIERGQLSSIPGEEVALWEKSKQNLGDHFGQFVPISPLVADMVTTSLNKKDRYLGVVDKIRLGAARQHLDAVLIYEVYSREDSKSNFLSIANLTIIGAYILPSKSVETQGFANALLIDVIQGYPYGTAEASLEKSEMTTTFGRSDKQHELANEIKTEVTGKLVKEVEVMFKNLKLALHE